MLDCPRWGLVFLSRGGTATGAVVAGIAMETPEFGVVAPVGAVSAVVAVDDADDCDPSRAESEGSEGMVWIWGGSGSSTGVDLTFKN